MILLLVVYNYIVRPVIIDVLVPANGTAGDIVVMTCNTTGYPSPSISWFRNDSLLTSSHKVTISSVTVLEESGLFSVSSNLQINGLVLNDTNVYSCISVNNLASRQIDHSDELSLTVLCK